MTEDLSPLLEIVTRCFRRPGMLAVNRASLARQTDADWWQTLLVDDIGIGVPAANARLADVAPALVGTYIWALDDDDECVQDRLVEMVRTLAESTAPDVIVMRIDHGPLGVLPPDELWGKRPMCGRIGGAAVIVRRELWQRCAGGWRTGRLAGDCDFILTLFDRAERVAWLDVVAARVQRISHGAPEESLDAC